MIIPILKRHETANRCLLRLAQAPKRELHQARLRSLVYSKSWYDVVVPEFCVWNEMVRAVCPDVELIAEAEARNPRTGRVERVYKLDARVVEIVEREHFFIVRIREVIESGGRECSSEGESSPQEVPCRAGERDGVGLEGI